jgi:hypothetical protein
MQRIVVLVLFITFAGFFVLTISASGESLRALISSVGAAFATAIRLGFSEVTGDQAVTIASTIITVSGTITATYLGIRWSRRGRDQ